MTLLTIALVLGALLPGQALAHRFGHPTIPANELLFGLGWAEPQEQDIFNIEFDVGLEADMTYQLVYYHNMTNHVSFGLHFFWSLYNVDPLTVEDEFGAFDVFFDLNSYNLGPRVRYTFWRSVFSPYWYAGGSYSFGSTSGNHPDFHRLGYNGFSMNTGLGMSLLPAQWLDISGEAFISHGWARWNQFPFLNSTSRDFDPSLYGVQGSVTVRF